MRELVAAHPTLPFDSIVRVIDPVTNNFVDVRIIDRGPFVKGRIIDLSFEAAKQLGFIEQGTLWLNCRCCEKAHSLKVDSSDPNSR